MPTDTTEYGLETLILNSLINDNGYNIGSSNDYDTEHAIDLPKLLRFIKKTQPEIFDSLNIEEEGVSRTKFLHRLQGEISKHGVINILRNGIKHGPSTVDLFYGTPTPGNQKARELYGENIFSVTLQP